MIDIVQLLPCNATAVTSYWVLYQKHCPTLIIDSAIQNISHDAAVPICKRKEV